MDRESRDRLVVIGGGLLIASGLSVAAVVAKPDIGSWLHPFFSTLLLPALAIAALLSMAVRRVLVGRAAKQDLTDGMWVGAWVYASLTFAVAFVCLLLVVAAVFLITPTQVGPFAEVLIALIALHLSLRLIVAILANTAQIRRGW